MRAITKANFYKPVIHDFKKHSLLGASNTNSEMMIVDNVSSGGGGFSSGQIATRTNSNSREKIETKEGTRSRFKEAKDEVKMHRNMKHFRTTYIVNSGTKAKGVDESREDLI